MGKVIYVPGAFESTFTHIDGRVEKINWWEHDKVWRHKYLLISAGAYNLTDYNLRERMRIPDDVIVIGDSGGFQQATRNFNLNPISVLRWQEKNCDIGVILDRPPYKLRDDNGRHPILEKSTSNFNKYLEITYDNARVMYDNRENKRLKLYGVIQGSNKHEIETWYDKINGIGDWDGWAIAPKPPGDLLSLAMYLKFIEENSINRLHIFLSTTIDAFMLVAYINSNYLDIDITMDSVSFLMAEKFGKIVSPITYKFTDLFSRKYIGDKDIKWVCDCPWCTSYRDDLDEYVKTFDINFYYIINMHNLYKLVTFVDMVNEYAKDYDLFVDIVKQVASNPNNVLSVIDRYDKGFWNKDIFSF